MREILLDTNVLVAAFRSKRGASYELVRLIGRLNISVALALEYEDVLKRNGVLEGITHNKRDFAAAEQHGVVVRTPGEFLKMLRKGQ